MLSKIIIFISLISLYTGSTLGCYFNGKCAYQYFATVTPYNAVRGDLRDLKRLGVKGCQAVSFWSLHRHGNRHPGPSITTGMKAVSALKDQIVAAYDAGKSLLCAQDIEDLRRWTWNDTLDNTPNELTSFGYKELYGIGARVRAAYPELMNGSPSDYYFRPTEEQRTKLSSQGFVQGLTDGTNLTLTIDSARAVDDVIRPYKNCPRYQQIQKNNTLLDQEIAAYQNSAAYQSVKTAVQNRQGISYQLSNDELFSMYELCRFYRSWEPNFQSPWCAFFTDQDLQVLEYKDDLKHYYRNGYGYSFVPRLGEMPLKSLYESFQAAVQGRGKKIVSLFSHDTQLEMTYSALGLSKDLTPLRGGYINPFRRWRTSYQVPKAMNLMVVLNRCQNKASRLPTYRVQIFLGEKVTNICPPQGCTWQVFQQKFQRYANSTLDFCTSD